MSSRIVTVPANQAYKLAMYSLGAISNATGVVFNEATLLNGFEFINDSNLVSVSCPNLVSVDPTNLVGGSVTVQACAACTSVSFPLLNIVGGSITVFSNPIVSVSFPSLVTTGISFGGSFAVGGSVMTSISAPLLTHVLGQMELAPAATCDMVFPALIDIQGDLLLDPAQTGRSFSAPNLTTINGTVNNTATPWLTSWNTPNWLPINGHNIYLSNGTLLDVTSVNQILARCVANPAYVSGQVFLGGAAPTGQGQTDKTTLLNRGVQVVTS